MPENLCIVASDYECDHFFLGHEVFDQRGFVWKKRLDLDQVRRSHLLQRNKLRIIGRYLTKSSGEFLLL